MVKKVKKTAGSPPPVEATPSGPGLLDGQFGQLVKESAQQIWSAGLAAFAKAQNSSGQAFDNLAAEGARLQKKTQVTTEERLGAVATRMSDMAGEVGTRAGQHWDKLESIFEDRVARALNRLGAPSAKDFEALNARLDALTEALKAQGVAPATGAVASAKAPKAPKGTKAAKAPKEAKATKATKTPQAIKAPQSPKAPIQPADAPAKRVAPKTAPKTAAAVKPMAKATPGTKPAAKASKAPKAAGKSRAKAR
ncbi:poly(hydroxyalkanoate) granule-associated protein [Roseateles sp. YR242]|uniref:phasin family protein n=1 Tax=Roseateles sp. YR242 TaxID=1855305 RepID=UPI0008C157D4|nr:phasin family protein [Roseateles sp. YR242]SEK96010.1 poly(hydroxyalkanoate) granule-associated protein [Roseateles sp. YR242]